MRLRPIEHLENRRPKCKMHTQYTFFVFYNWSTKKTEPTVFQNRTEPAVFLKTETEPNLKNPFRTSLLLIHICI